MARFTTLYSGSSGNSGVVEEDGRFILVDMGCSCRATIRGMEQLGLEPGQLSAILITHEHIDHIRGLRVFLKKHPTPVYASLATLDALWHMDAVPEETELIAVDGREEDICGFTVRGFSTSHDAAGCCGFRVRTPSGAEMAIATDLGVVTVEVYQQLQNTSLVALEANYDREMLRTGPYPVSLKRRVASKQGHLSNEMCANILAQLVGEGCQKVALCHLSENNNYPHLALQAVEEAFFAAGLNPQSACTVQAMPRHEPGDWMEF